MNQDYDKKKQANYMTYMCYAQCIQLSYVPIMQIGCVVYILPIN